MTAGAVAGGENYGRLVEAAREFLERLASAVPDDATVVSLTRDLTAWSDRLAAAEVAEHDQVFGHRGDLVGRGQTMAPLFLPGKADARAVHGTVTFGRYYMWAPGAVHGGAIPLLFDEVMGRLSNSAGRVPARTAWLRVDYRAATPVRRQLEVRAWLHEESGRKRILRGELRDGGTVCAEAEGLFIARRPAHPAD